MIKVGRNDLCPCGSGKKYKKCCLNNTSDFRALWNKNINLITEEEHIDSRIAKVFSSLLYFLYQAKWTGACHGVSAILYLIYSELGFKPELCTGIICRDIWMSGHSWIEMNGKVYDAACFFPVEGCPKIMPVFNGLEVDTMKASSTAYGVSVPSSMAADVQMMLDKNTTLPKVLNGEYENIAGASLWNVVDNICLLAGINSIFNVTDEFFDTTGLTEKYEEIHWNLCDQLAVPSTEKGAHYDG